MLTTMKALGITVLILSIVTTVLSIIKLFAAPCKEPEPKRKYVIYLCIGIVGIILSLIAMIVL